LGNQKHYLPPDFSRHRIHRLSFCRYFERVGDHSCEAKETELQNCINFKLVSLAIADLLAGAIYVPLFAVVEILMVRQVAVEHLCMLDSLHLLSLTIFSALSSIYHLTFIAWERYVAVRKWMNYKVIVTKNLVKILALIAWLVAKFPVAPLFILIAIDVDQEVLRKRFLVMSIWVAFCLIVIVLFYVMVYLGVRKRNTNQLNKVTALIRGKLESRAAKMTGLVSMARNSRQACAMTVDT